MASGDKKDVQKVVAAKADLSAERRPYEAPRLQALGSVAAITLGSSGVHPDGIPGKTS